MNLSSELISQFVKATNDEPKTSSESTVYGTTVEYNGRMYVRIDGSDRLTPIETTTDMYEDERVAVTIKNHTATVTGNYSSPSARTDDVQEIGNKVTEFETVVADKVDTKQLAAEIARIDTLVSDNVTIKEKLTATEAEIGELVAENAEITGKLTATEAEIDEIQADVISVKATFADYAKIEELDAIDATIRNLEATYGDFVELTTDHFTAVDAEINDLQTNKLSVKDAELQYANIDFSNIGEAAIEKLFSDSGIIKDLIMSDGKVTGTLDAININADWIKSGTLQTDRLLLKGPDGLYYALNVTENGDATVTDKYTSEELQNGLLGSNIIAKSITAEKIAVDDLTAFGAYLAGFNIKDLKDAEGNYLTSAIYSGVKQSVHNSTDGIYLDKDGQLAVGNGDEYLKFYRDDNGVFHLAIAASTIRLGSGKTVEEAVNEATDMEIGARNLIRNSKTLVFNSYYFMSNPAGTYGTSVLAEAVLGDMILGEE